ncbi:hypothetical protein ACFL5K_03660 [Gemmatimonadota bacterium]
MKYAIILLITFCFSSWVCLDYMLAESNSTKITVGKVTFVKGKVVGGSESNPHQLKPGQSVSENDIVITASGAKAKVLLTKNKTLATILADTKVRITAIGVEIIEGSSKNIAVKKLEFLRPIPELSNRSRHLGGTFVMRGAEQEIKILSLKSTFIRETSPTFRWKSSKSGSFLVSLYQIDESGGNNSLWKSRTSLDSLTFPVQQTDLDKGKSYYWEITDSSSSSSETTISARFYVLTSEEEKALNKELTQLEKLLKDDAEDEYTRDFLKLELLTKYHLNDELKDYLLDLLIKHPENEDLKKMVKSL